MKFSSLDAYQFSINLISVADPVGSGPFWSDADVWDWILALINDPIITSTGSATLNLIIGTGTVPTGTKGTIFVGRLKIGTQIFSVRYFFCLPYTRFFL
jgi:hypothetical protein